MSDDTKRTADAKGAGGDKGGGTGKATDVAEKTEKAEKKADKAERGRRPKAAATGRGPLSAKGTTVGAAPVRTGLPTPAWVAISVALLVVGVLCGHFLLSSPSSVSLGGRTTLGANELDSTIATYTYNGKTTSVSARDVIEQPGSTATAADDGSYDVPGPSDVLSYVQSQIVFDEADRRGVTVSDDEVDDFAQTNFGTSDYATIAQSYGMEEDDAKAVIRNYALLSKLRGTVVTTQMPEQPTAPTEPADGSEDTPTADYASYIINLVGDEWDSEAGTWARTDGDYYATLSSYDITNDSATYAAAKAAYTVAANKYSSAYTQVSQEWTTFTNSLLSNATIQIGSLATPSSTAA